MLGVAYGAVLLASWSTDTLHLMMPGSLEEGLKGVFPGVCMREDGWEAGGEGRDGWAGKNKHKSGGEVCNHGGQVSCANTCTVKLASAICPAVALFAATTCSCVCDTL